MKLIDVVNAANENAPLSTHTCRYIVNFRNELFQMCIACELQPSPTTLLPVDKAERCTSEDFKVCPLNKES